MPLHLLAFIADQVGRGWARIVSRFYALEPADTLAAWCERMLDAAQSCSQHSNQGKLADL